MDCEKDCCEKDECEHIDLCECEKKAVETSKETDVVEEKV